MQISYLQTPAKILILRFADRKTGGFAVRRRLKNREIETFRCKTIDFAPLFVRFYKLFVRLYLVTLETLLGKTYAFTYKSLTISLVGSKRKLHTLRRTPQRLLNHLFTLVRSKLAKNEKQNPLSVFRGL